MKWTHLSSGHIRAYSGALKPYRSPGILINISLGFFLKKLGKESYT